MLRGNAQCVQYVLNNLTVGAVGAAATVFVDVTISAVPSSWIGALGIAMPTDANLNSGLPAPNARITSTTNLRLGFVNPSAGGLTPAATLDYNVFLFIPQQIQQTI